MLHKYIDKYRYIIVWSEEDKEFIGQCTEFPSLSHLDKDRMKAMQGIYNLVASVVEELAKNKEPIPEPIYSRRYSGKLNIRMPEEQHRKLSVEAAENGVSLNSLIVHRLK